MATRSPRHRGVHLIGSVPLPDAETVFRTVVAALGPHLARVPDGETGERRRWIFFQRAMLRQPMATAYMYVSPAARAAYIPVYERSLRRALDDILAAVPAPQLSLQWDVCQEVLIYEGFFADRPGHPPTSTS